MKQYPYPLTPEVVDCKLCTEYTRKDGCTADTCVCMEERIEAGAVTYEDARLEEMEMIHFDCWASRFGETKTALELAPEGKGYRPRTRFSRFHNLPELMNLFKEVADIKTADQLHLPVPEVEYHTIVSQPTEIQKGLVQNLSERAAAIHSGCVPPETDNMLKITSDGRKLGLDQRLINPNFPDEEGTKVNLCVENILQVWHDGAAGKLTQLVFCDVSTPKSDGTFNVYDDIRSKLIARGIPDSEIAYIHDARTDAKKKELFGKVRSGQVRVLLGSTAKMGAGTNCQDRLVAIHDLDCPWRPGDLAQRKGRIERQGNMNKLVHVFRYVTEGTFELISGSVSKTNRNSFPRLCPANPRYAPVMMWTKPPCPLRRSRHCAPEIPESRNGWTWMWMFPG